AAATAYPQPAPGNAEKPGPLKVPDDRLLHVLGYRTVEVAMHGPATVANYELA
ncbi:MAG: metallophosphoesterase, partial [Candidatus Eremiobacteraeota bacterium]|nr:metallophosphoesterase [Candidatus Eremiobacteraeota bacterium]